VAAFYNVAANPSFTLASTVYGFGTVEGLLTAAGGTISPGVNNVAGSPDAGGTLNFANGLTENGSVINKIELSTVGNATNDLINVTGNLNVSGVNNITLSHFGGGADSKRHLHVAYLQRQFCQRQSCQLYRHLQPTMTCVLANPAGAITVNHHSRPRVPQRI
jgi:hypothetical protein